MTETMAPAELDFAVGETVSIRIEEDASPIVRLISRTLGDSASAGHALGALQTLKAVVALHSHDTPQAAIIAFGAGVIEVSSGLDAEPDATITVDLNARFAPVGDQVGADGVICAVLQALTPPLPDWREAAASFWCAGRSLRGIPDRLIAIAADSDGGIETLVLGEGDSQYVIAGPSEILAGIFTGADDLIAVLYSGAIGIRGTLSQLSVMTGVSWKVRYDA